LSPSSLGERLHTDPGERAVRLEQVFSGIDPPSLPTKPFPEQKVRPRSVGRHSTTAKPVDCLPVEALSVRSVAQDRTTTRREAQGPLRSRGLSALCKSFVCFGSQASVVATAGSLDELRQRPDRVGLAGTLGGGRRNLVATEAVVEKGGGMSTRGEQQS